MADMPCLMLSYYNGKKNPDFKQSGLVLTGMLS